VNILTTSDQPYHDAPAGNAFGKADERLGLGTGFTFVVLSLHLRCVPRPLRLIEDQNVMRRAARNWGDWLYRLVPARASPPIAFVSIATISSTVAARKVTRPAAKPVGHLSMWPRHGRNHGAARPNYQEKSSLPPIGAREGGKPDRRPLAGAVHDLGGI
jgi:hypothetical protein